MPLNSQGISNSIINGHALDPTRPPSSPGVRGHHINEFHARLGDEENYPELDVYDENGNIDNEKMNQLMEDTMAADDTRVLRSNLPPHAVHMHNPSTNVVIVMNPSNDGDLGTVFRANSPRYLENKIRNEQSDYGVPKPPIKTGANSVERHVERFNVDLQQHPASLALLQRRSDEIGQPYQAPQIRPQAPAKPSEPVPTVDPNSPEGQLSQRIQNDFSGVSQDDIIVEGDDMVVSGEQGRELNISRMEGGGVEVQMMDEYGQRTMETLSQSQAADFLADMGQRLGAAGGAALGLAAGITAFASGASASEAAIIVVETSVPLGEAAVAAVEGDIEGAARASFSEAGATGGCIAGGWALGTWAAGLGIITGPGAAIAGTVGGVVGCIGGAIIGSFGAETAFDIASKGQPLRNMNDRQADTVYGHLPDEIAEGMPPELQSLVEMKRRMEQMEPESEEHTVAMQEFKEFLGTDITAQSANEIASYMRDLHNNTESSPSTAQVVNGAPAHKFAEHTM